MRTKSQGGSTPLSLSLSLVWLSSYLSRVALFHLNQPVFLFFFPPCSIWTRFSRQEGKYKHEYAGLLYAYTYTHTQQKKEEEVKVAAGEE